MEIIKSQLKSHTSLTRECVWIWIHVASAGEFLQALPVMESLKIKKPNIKILLTFISPSGEKWTKQANTPADIISYYPLDSINNVRTVLNWINPKAIIFVKFDLWPNLITQAHQNKIPIYIISATLTTVSKRLSNPFVTKFFASLYKKMTAIFTVSSKDEMLFLNSIGKKDNKPLIETGGDTRVDSVLQRQKKFSQEKIPTFLEHIRKQKRPILVVGSSWDWDEEVVLKAFAKILPSFPDCLLILTPHEPTPEHLGKIQKELRNLNLSYTTYTQLSSSFSPSPFPSPLPSPLQHPSTSPSSSHFPGMKFSAPVLVVDQVGLLASLYRIGDIAFVGSGQGGVHNTMEPAAWNLPVLFGPHYHNAPEAITMVQNQLAFSIQNSQELERILIDFFQDESYRTKIGNNLRKFLEESSGATEKYTQKILSQIFQ